MLLLLLLLLLNAPPRGLSWDGGLFERECSALVNGAGKCGEGRFPASPLSFGQVDRKLLVHNDTQ